MTPLAKLLVTLVVLVSVLNPAHSASVSISPSTSVTVSPTFSIMPSIMLPAPSMVTNSCPGHRELLCLQWSEPGGYFYPSFNVYFRVQGTATYTVVNIQALSVNLNGTYINAATSYTVTITGVTYTGAESPMAPPNTFTTAVADPRDNPIAGVSNVMFTTGSVFVTFSFTPGSSTIQRYNVRFKCKKPSGHIYKIRKTFYRPGSAPVSRTIYSFLSGSTCKAKLRFWYFDENSLDNSQPRAGPKMPFRNIVIP